MAFKTRVIILNEYFSLRLKNDSIMYASIDFG